MGKKNFKDLYKRIKREHGTITCKTSYFCDNFNATRDYAGAIIYAIDGKFTWKNHGKNEIFDSSEWDSVSNDTFLVIYLIEGGKANGYGGKSFYIIIQCTNEWPADCRKAAGQGRVHDYLLKNVMGIEYDQDRIACGGFAYVNGELKFSSIWLNGRNQTDAESDGDKMLSEPEKILAIFCFNEYIRHGRNHKFEVPSLVDRALSN